METEFIYWAHKLPWGVEVIEVCGGEDKSPRLWRLLADQLIAENSEDGNRTIGHFPSGAPLFEGENRRVSLTHTKNFMAVAYLPESPVPVEAEAVDGEMLGIDAERVDREQVLRIRERFLGQEELEMIAPEDLPKHILAWTIKEAVYKAMLTPGLDFRRDIRIKRFPDPGNKAKGEGIAVGPDGREHRFGLCSWLLEGHCLTVAKG